MHSNLALSNFILFFFMFKVPGKWTKFRNYVGILFFFSSYIFFKILFKILISSEWNIHKFYTKCTKSSEYFLQQVSKIPSKNSCLPPLIPLKKNYMPTNQQCLYLIQRDSRGKYLEISHKIYSKLVQIFKVLFKFKILQKNVILIVIKISSKFFVLRQIFPSKLNNIFSTISFQTFGTT